MTTETHGPATLNTNGEWRAVESPERVRMNHIRDCIAHAAHLIPSQGPLRVFIHHNTLHAFEDSTFDEAVLRGAQVYGCEPYLTEDRYHEKLARGRIRVDDIGAVLQEDLAERGSEPIGPAGTRLDLRLAMMQHPIRTGTEAEIRWLMAESDALRRFRTGIPAELRDQMVAATQHWIMRDLRHGRHQATDSLAGIESVLATFDGSTIERWNVRIWEAVTLQVLWHLCQEGVSRTLPTYRQEVTPLRHRDILWQAAHVDTDRLVHEFLIRYCAVFLDQGISHWTLPDRHFGFLQGLTGLYRDIRPVRGWLRQLPDELRHLSDAKIGALQSIDESLRQLGVSDDETEEYLAQTLLALRGWAGMLWQMETNAEWAVWPAPLGTLTEFIAVRLILERLALTYVLKREFTEPIRLSELRPRLAATRPHRTESIDPQRAYLLFQLAQLRGWNPEDLFRLTAEEWQCLLHEIEQFSDLQRRRIYHLAFERRYRQQTLDAMLVHAAGKDSIPTTPTFQVVCCIDEREESFRRHLEEIAPGCETFGTAGFFGVAMYYKGIVDAHHIPLCPVVMKPKHFVEEEAVFSLQVQNRRRTEARRAVGKLSHRWHVVSRLGLGGIATALVGSVASVPLVARVLFPRLTARLRQILGNVIQPPPVTRLILERTEIESGPLEGHRGYSLDEMATIVERLLRDIGLTRRFSPLVVITGHGSSSLNNPHESAHDCGACGGGRGGPNARAFAQMAGDRRVRERLAQNGLVIPDDTVFVGAYHNTCDDQLVYYDLDRLPTSHQKMFSDVQKALDIARRRNAHERCRRFESAPLEISCDDALKHVEARAEDLSQVRPEYGHATNAVCFVGRRNRTRGLYLDRRTFLTSYDPTQDDADGTILTRILQAVIPVCAGINLEYYFSYVDPTRYGCGTKLPHNITSLLGVVDGAASDLRSGLPWQMVEIHEPVRILFLIETTPETMHQIVQRNPTIGQLVRNAWVQLAVLDPHSADIHLFKRGTFAKYSWSGHDLPFVDTSIDWYRGWREHLGYAAVRADGGCTGREHERPQE